MCRLRYHGAGLQPLSRTNLIADSQIDGLARKRITWPLKSIAEGRSAASDGEGSIGIVGELWRYPVKSLRGQSCAR